MAGGGYAAQILGIDFDTDRPRRIAQEFGLEVGRALSALGQQTADFDRASKHSSAPLSRRRYRADAERGGLG